MQTFKKGILEEIENILIQKAKDRETITYTQLVETINKNNKLELPLNRETFSRKLPIYLHEICKKSYREKGYMLGAIVVRKDLGYPSEGFFKFAQELTGLKLKNKEDKIKFWQSQVNKIFEDLD